MISISLAFPVTGNSPKIFIHGVGELPEIKQDVDGGYWIRIGPVSIIVFPKQKPAD